MDFVENTFPCFSSNLFFLSWWILVSIYAIPMLSILYMLLSVHLYGFNKCGYLGNTCIDYNTVLCLSWSWLTVILIHYDECLVSVGALYFVLFIMLCFLPSFLWWVTSKSLWVHSYHLPVLIGCCGIWYILLSVNTTLHTAAHNFWIEIRECCSRLGKMYDSIAFSGRCSKFSLNFCGFYNDAIW